MQDDLVRRIEASCPPLPDASAETGERLLQEALSTFGPRARQRRTIVAVAVAAVVTVVLASVALAWDIGGISALVSGEPVPAARLSEGDRFTLERLTGDESGKHLEPDAVMLLGERNGRAYYALGRGEDICFASGPAAQKDLFGSATCAPGFPSPEQPILEFTVYTGRPGELDAHPYRFDGIAADGVARVGFREPSGRLHTTPVIDNIYSLTNVSDLTVASVVGLDRDGRTVYDRCVARAGCGQSSARDAQRLTLLDKIPKTKAGLSSAFGEPTSKRRLTEKECWKYETRSPAFEICFFERGGTEVRPIDR
jgi:hypothetical protein